MPSTARGARVWCNAGRADEAIDNSKGGNGDQHILLVRRHKAFLWENDGSVKQEHVCKPAYVVDNQTVAATDGSAPAQGGGQPTAASRSAAGTIIMLDAAGVWVE
ncbi:MAG: hypothetical protein ACMX3H_16990 [Sodalis sp. (in: enterobacteria)]|uniref:hypothetical protein n=1 Tax=Sodalis sp. (in: enterobacteria) TaxID=1898979 RepID=UPI0039E3E8F8